MTLVAGRNRTRSLSPLDGRGVVGAPTVTAISPDEGVEAGGTEVTITGTRFYAGATVTIGGNACTSVVVVSDISIQCVTPAGTGTDNVVVTTSYGPGTLASGYEYTGSPPSGLTAILQVKYATTGTSDAVLLGSGETFPFNSRSGTGGEVLVATGLDFPTTNCLRVPWTLFTFIRKNNFTAQASGTNRNYRYYIRVAWPDGTSDSETHPMQDGNSAAEANWMFKVLNRTGKWRPSLWAGNGRQAYPNNNWTADLLELDKNATYRVEVQEVRVSASTYRLHIWIYNSSNVLVADDSNFYRTDSSTVLLSTNPTFSNMNTGTTTADALVGFNAGCNDTGAEAGNYAYQGGFAVVNGLTENVQIGAYGTVTGEEAP